VRAGKGVSPGFLFASLLWHQVLEKWNAYRAAGEAPIPALHLAADDVLDNQTDSLALQRRIATDMRDIWARASAPASTSCCCAANRANWTPNWATGGPPSMAPTSPSASV
jgi:tRNA nucleotidyltransferase/poly(A) polymerase